MSETHYCKHTPGTACANCDTPGRLTIKEQDALAFAVSDDIDWGAAHPEGRPFTDTKTVAAVESIVAARTDDLRRWKSEALDVMDGLQELGEALKLPLGERITGPKAVEAVQALTAERDTLRIDLRTCERLSREAADAARAELAAANARCAELGCSCICSYCDCIEGRKDTRERVESILAERDALQATLDRVADVLDQHWDWKAGRSLHAAVRAALTPEGTE